MATIIYMSKYNPEYTKIYGHISYATDFARKESIGSGDFGCIPRATMKGILDSFAEYRECCNYN